MLKYFQFYNFSAVKRKSEVKTSGDVAELKKVKVVQDDNKDKEEINNNKDKEVNSNNVKDTNKVSNTLSMISNYSSDDD